MYLTKSPVEIGKTLNPEIIPQGKQAKWAWEEQLKDMQYRMDHTERK